MAAGSVMPVTTLPSACMSHRCSSDLRAIACASRRAYAPAWYSRRTQWYSQNSGTVSVQSSCGA
eukprot:6021797-Pyramimonas_sp.AAC.2